MADIVNMSAQFKGLPMADLIGAPLTAACDAQVKLARATSDFIQLIGFAPDPAAAAGTPGTPITRTASFRFKRPVDRPATAQPGDFYEEEVEMEVPLLALVKVPALSITTVDVNFEMEVKSSFAEHTSEDSTMSASLDASVNWGVFSAKVHVQGSVSSHKDNTRTSDNSAKYTVAVHAEDKGMPEGLSRVLDILQSSVAPRKVAAPVQVQ
ncbi:DUF2589 domain-containing protein [Amantichitinum ursilacus]|uniref:DUF2589 domain-containing protein n=1 Tax=Amantichitinum ursilacus TaxID=857265 RepID=A0A0N0GNC3_9NEIS|nr:DUF2589 domain-containing protein [Amantichitinum ursilacus]KPC52585.1 hypothetical protein WG78_12095 [Amantichitinum ursilacus]